MGETRRPIVTLNGKWLTQPMTGTQRYATEIARRLVDREGPAISIAVPRDAVVPAWAASATIRRSWWTGVMFEQIALPMTTVGRLLVNLSGSSPLLKRRQIVTLFDASVFRYGSTFSLWFRWWYKFQFRTSLLRSRRLLTVSKFSRDELTDVLGLRPSQLTIAPCGSEHFPLPTSAFESPLDGRYVVVVGRISERKNLSGPLSALSARGIRSAVVGDPGPTAVFAPSALPADPNIVLLGRLTDQQIADLMTNAVAVLFPSRYEGFGLPVVEAQRVGCPVVCSSAGSLREVAGDGALFFHPDQPDSVVEHVERLAIDVEFRDAMVSRGRENALRFSWDRSAAVVSQVIREARSSRSVPAG